MTIRHFTTVTTTLSDRIRDDIEAAFDGYCTSASSDEVLDDMAKKYIRDIETLTAIRLYFGASGAMRWPWSQEAPVTSPPPKIG
jgi:hypothetical protein